MESIIANTALYRTSYADAL